MTDKEKLEKIKSLADKMYDAAFNITTDASLLRKAMNEYHQFLIYEYHKEEPVSEKFAFKSIPRLLEMIEPTDRAKAYCQKLIDSLEQEGYSIDAKIARNCLKQMNGEKVAMATMDEEPVSDELEKVVEEIVDPTVLNAYGVKEIANRLRRTMIEPVSEELEKVSKEWLAPQLDKSYAGYGEAKMMELTRFDSYAMLDAIEFGAKWQKEKDQDTVEIAKKEVIKETAEWLTKHAKKYYFNKDRYLGTDELVEDYKLIMSM